MIELVTGKEKMSEEKLKQSFDLMTKLDELILETDTNRDKLYDHFQVENNTDLTNEQLKEAISILEKKKRGE